MVTPRGMCAGHHPPIRAVAGSARFATLRGGSTTIRNGAIHACGTVKKASHYAVAMSSPPPVPIRIAVINDYELVVKGVAAMVQPYSSWVKVAELNANTPVDEPVDVGLYDTFGSAQADRANLEEMLANPNVRRLVVYTWNMDPVLIQAAARAGVAGYLSKSMTGPDLVDALVRVHRGDRVVSRDPGRQAPVAGDWPGRADGLTVRESEVVALITQGLSNDEVAARSHLSINSVKSYIRSAYRKMGVSRRSQAVLWGIKHGFQPDRERIG